MDVINNYANKDKVAVHMIFADDGTYGVNTIITATGHSNTEWFDTQEEQQAEYLQVIREVSKGEWL